MRLLEPLVAFAVFSLVQGTEPLYGVAEKRDVFPFPLGGSVLFRCTGQIAETQLGEGLEIFRLSFLVA